MFAFLVNVFFGGHWTDSLNESRIITRKAFDEYQDKKLIFLINKIRF